MNEYFNKKFQKIGSFLLAFIMIFSLIGADFLAYAQSDVPEVKNYNGEEEIPLNLMKKQEQ